SAASYKVGGSSTATGTIQDDDTATFTINDATASEGGTLTFTVSLNMGLDKDRTMDVTYSDGLARGGIDYDSTDDRVTFKAGEKGDKTVSVRTSEDDLVEALETFRAILSTATPLGGRSVDLSDKGTGSIQDDDTAIFSINDATATEGGDITFTVSV